MPSTRGHRTPRCRSRSTSSDRGAAARGAGGRLPPGAHERREQVLRRLILLAYVVRRLFLAVLTVWAISGAVLRDHPSASRRLRDLLYRLDVGVGKRGLGGRSEGFARAARSRPAYHRPIRQVDGAHAPGQFRHGDGMGAAGDRRHRRSSDADHGHLGGGDRLHVGTRSAHRHLFRRPPLLIPGLRVHVCRFHRSRDPGIPAGADRHVRRLRLFRRQRRRALLARVREAPWSWARVVGPDQCICRSRRSCWAYPARRS